MSIFSKLLGKKTAEGADETVRVGGMEDFMTLIRVYGRLHDADSCVLSGSNGSSAGYQ